MYTFVLDTSKEEVHQKHCISDPRMLHGMPMHRKIPKRRLLSLRQGTEFWPHQAVKRSVAVSATAWHNSNETGENITGHPLQPFRHLRLLQRPLTVTMAWVSKRQTFPMAKTGSELHYAGTGASHKRPSERSLMSTTTDPGIAHELPRNGDATIG